ncbi:MAG: sigma-70 family RNA polymerase sigma factor [candidate division Zixibacteria bacterium]|nr:sigma-70 family RNA polymerase sigma factor [candidate division Zixibacteria bacterium]
MPKRKTTTERPKRPRPPKSAGERPPVGAARILAPALPIEPPDDENDETHIKEVIKEVQAGKGHLFREIIDRYRSQVTGIAFKMVGDYDDAKDITQMVFVKTFYNINRFDATKRFSTWLYRIAVNASIDYIRKFKKHKFEELDDLTEPRDAPLQTQTPEQVYRLKELREYVLKAARKLNEKQYTAFVLKDLEGLDIDEIAQIMGMPQATVRWYLHRARKHLRTDLRRHFGPILNKLGIIDHS